MPVFLVPVDGLPPISIDKPIVFFGRSEDCDVALVTSRKVSRKHCLIAVIDDHFVIRDLGSMNGVKVNQKQVKKEARFQIGDEVTIGDIAYRLAVMDAPPKKSPPKMSVPAQVSTPVKPEPIVKPLRTEKPAPTKKKADSDDFPIVLDSEDQAPLFGGSSPKKGKSRSKKRSGGKEHRGGGRGRGDSSVIELDDVDLVEDDE